MSLIRVATNSAVPVGMDYDWTCDRCGHRNKRDSLAVEKVCEDCGYDPRWYDGLEAIVDDDRPRGIE